MNRLTVVIACAVVFAGCASNVQTRTSVSEIEQAKQAVYSCNQRGVRQYDDGLTSPRKIALIIADSCDREWMQYVKLTRPLGRRTPYMVGWYHRMSLRQREQATQAVILARSRQASR